MTLEHVHAVYAQADVLYRAEEVEAALDRMAAEITRVLKDSNPLVIGVMTGGMIPAGRILPRLDFPLEIDYLHATRYCGETRGGKLHWIARPQTPLRDRVVLIVDDILDEGLTLAAILEECRAEGAKAVYSAVLVEKLHDRKAKGAHADFVGLQVVDRYVFGYGMDYKGYLRNAPGIYAVKGM
ncbi:MAG: hypoxanthine-guanine phosphoribosyltransferase [Gammaproteobacteria bacterium]